MKLLLTSFGISTPELAQALEDLVQKPRHQTRIGFIPTAANVEEGKKDWFIDQLTHLQNHGFTWIDMVDISAAAVDWQARLAGVDVVFVSGGNTYHLLDQVRRTGFDRWLKGVLDRKVYVGSSAGSIIAAPTIAVAAIEPGDLNLPGLTDLAGMGLVDFEINPHTPEIISPAANENYAKRTHRLLYAMNDLSAIQVVGAEVKVLAKKGDYQVYNQ
jgi:dipeptidase E